MDTSDRPAASSTGKILGGVVGCGCLILLVVGGLVGLWFAGVFAAIAVPNFVEMQNKARRAETVGNVAGIRTAELAYEAAYDGYLSVGSESAARAALTAEPHEWQSSPEWEQLGWRPDGKVRGGYWVEATPTGFTVHGLVDADGDGVPAEYIATERQEATLVSPSDVY